MKHTPALALPLLFALACGGTALSAGDAGPDPSPDGGSDGGADGDGGHDAGPESDAEAAADAGVALESSLAPALSGRDLSVTRGHVGWFLAEDCAELDDCYANNPASPYGLVYLPPADDEVLTEVPPFFVDGDARASWRLDTEEAVVLVGRTPPEAAYFGFTPYLFDREGTELFASLGDTLNTDALAAATGSAPFSLTFAYVFVSNQALANQIVGALVDGGVPAAAVHVQPIPTEYVRFGHDAAADSLSFLLRTALPTDEAAMAAYREDTPIEVFRVRANTALAPASLSTLPLRSPGLSGVDERALESALEDLRNTLVAQYRAVPLPFVEADLQGYECIESDRECLGDNLDTPYLAAVPQQLDAGERLLVYGVRHDLTGLATYIALGVTRSEGRRGIGGFTGVEASGSAAAYLPDHPDADQLFVYELARECGTRPYCFEVPTGEAGVPLGETMLLTWRAYLQPGTQTGPLVSDLLVPRLLRPRS